MARRAGAGTLKRRKDGKYEGRWTDENGRWRERVLSTDRAVAQDELDKIIAARDREKAGLPPVRKPQTVLSLFESYDRDHLSRKSAKHREDEKERLMLWMNELGQPEDPANITGSDVEAFRSYLLGHGKSNRTVNAYLKSLKACLNWGVRMGLIDRNPIAGVRLLPEREKDQVRRRRALSDDECKRLLAGAYTTVDSAHFLAIEILLYTGLRYAEMACLVDDDITHKDVRVRAENAKSGKLRVVPIPVGMTNRHLDWFEVYGEFDPNDSSALRASLYKALDAAGIPRVDDQGRRVDLHALRHTYGTRMARAGMSPALLMVLMGHAKIETTLKHYVHLEGEDARAIIDRVGGF